MYGATQDRLVDPRIEIAPGPEIASGPFDPTIATDGFVFEPLAQWAGEAPSRLALVSGSLSYTYAELEALTNRLARALRTRGVECGSRVALVLPRGPQAVVALLGVLKAGAAYVPLDAESPTERVRLCLEDALPDLVIARDDRAPLFEGATTIGVEALLAEAAPQSGEPLTTEEVDLDPDDLAYVIFTSGTTGRPKGVPITHRSLTNFVRGDQAACMKVQPDDRVFQGFSPASDGHHEEVWPTLQAGATLVVAMADDVHAGSELGSFLEQHRVTIISCAPTLLSMVEGDVPTLRRVLFGAERCPEEMVRRWWRPGREIINTYGPTEATVGATFAPLMPDAPVTIGKPLPNYYCYVLDGELKAVPVGEIGELCISGIGVSDGYLGRPELNAEKFVENPYYRPELHNPRLYKTGDRARLNEDGNIEWLGRVDSQVKVRGYRIELSDIETHLMREPEVRSAVAVLRDADTPEPVLVALVVPKKGKTVDASACLARLRRELPIYMVPQWLEAVDSLPALPSGKIDRRGIVGLRGKRLAAERHVEPPQTATERMLVDIWQQLFSGAPVCRTDDFFMDLGGYSLLAAKFISILRNERGLRSVSMLDIYEYPRLKEFAAYVDAKSGTQTAPPASVPEFAPVPPARYRLATMWQGLGILFTFGYRAMFWLAPVLSASYALTLDWSPLKSVLLGLAVHALSVPVGLLLVVAMKWIVIGRFKPGMYPIWGTYFVRWWFIQRMMDLAPRNYITGTPLASVFLRLMGSRVGHNVVIESLDIDCPDLIAIENDCMVEERSWVRASSVAHGYLTIAPIKIGRGSMIGVRSGVCGGASLGEGAFLGDLSCLDAGQHIPAGQEWSGSPARQRENQAPPYDHTKQPTTRLRLAFGAVQSAFALAIPLIEGLPFIWIALMFYQSSDELHTYLWTPIYSIFLTLGSCATLLAVKWTLVQRVKPGTYKVPSWFWLRRWLVDKMIEVETSSIVPIYDTLYARPWCIALGMKCGPRTEIALPARMPYDLVELGEESFVCSDSSIGMPMRRNSTLVLEKTVGESRVFLGNDSVVAQGARIPTDTLLGALSTSPPAEVMGDEPGNSWLGSPSFKMPRREHFDYADVECTYKPNARLYAERLLHETIRVIMPGMASLLVAAAMLTTFDELWDRYHLTVALISVPFLDIAAALVGFVSLYLMKRLLIGTYHPGTHPLWSKFVWKTETFSTYLHDFAGPLFISPMLGTPYLNAFLRFMGAKIGRRAFIDSGDMTEFDLLSVGEDAALNHCAPLQAHLFEDRMMKLGRIHVGDRCSVGNYSVILFDTELKPDSHVGHISLVMKGETIPSGTIWEGSPAQARVG